MGSTLIRRLLDELPHVLAYGGVALLEIGSDQGEAALAAAVAAPPGLAGDRPLGPRPACHGSLEIERPPA